MKKLIFIFLVVSSAALFAQVGDPQPTDVQDGVDNSNIVEVSVEKFEIDGAWSAYLSSDSGFISSRLFDGGPSNKEPIASEQEAGLDLPDTKVLGVRVDYLHRGAASILIYPQHPIPIEGITKTVSIWVAGRNFEHNLVLLFQDCLGRNFEVSFGKLNFQGWRKLTAAIPPQNGFGKMGIVQRNLHFAGLSGIRVTGLRIDTDPMESYGTYYVYLDDMRAQVDTYAENSHEPDDPSDDW